MSFLAPYMLWGALAAGIPVALHFFYRSRYRNVPWAAMKFLLAAVEQTSRRLRFQELLLLMLRVALLVVLALALARPSGVAGTKGGRGDAVDAVLVLDNSLSMGARAGVAPPQAAANDAYQSALKELAGPGGAVTRLDRAKAAALAVLANLPPYSTVQVLTCSDRAATLGPQAPSHLDQARPLILDARLSSLGTDFLPGVQAAAELLKRGPSPNKELYLFSDMQKGGWEAQAAALRPALAELREAATVHLVHCGGAAPANVSVVGITPQSTLQTGERADFAVLVRNAGREAVRNLTVGLEVGGQPKGRDTQALPEVKGGETRAVVLSGSLDKPGRHVLTATVRPDDLEADNTFHQVIHVQDQVGVLVVDGDPGTGARPADAASFHVLHALSPVQPGVGKPLPVVKVPAEEASPKLLAGVDLCVLVNVRLAADDKGGGGGLPPEFLRALPAFVKEGRGLMVFAGDRVDPAAYNALLGEQAGLLPLKISKIDNAPAKAPWRLDRASAAAPFDRFRQDEAYAGVDKVEVRRLLGLEGAKADLPADVRVLLRCDNGRPAIVSKKRPGEGEVMLFATSAHDLGWTTWFTSPMFVPFMQEAFKQLLGGRPELYNTVAGEEIHYHPPREDAGRPYDLLGPDGARLRLGLPASERGRPLLTARDTGLAGVYRVVAAGGSAAEGIPFAVTPDLRETQDLTSLTPARVDEALGFRAVHLQAADDGAPFSGAERLRREWTVWLLAALLALVLGEAALAWFCGRAW